MSLPIVLEIAVGLIFIYLTLSLVASEIQEILSALFQWRAEHLKRSIEQLLAGDIDTRKPDSESDALESRKAERKQRKADQKYNAQAAKTLADRLYDTPLIENLNYEAQGPLAKGLRAILHGIGAVYRTFTFSRNVFGDKTSGPSYIPAETFATSLIERLQLADFEQLLVRSRFKEFVESEIHRPLYNSVHELRACLGNEDLLTAEVAYLNRGLTQIIADLSAQRIPLDSALQQLSLELATFESMAADGAISANSAMGQSFSTRLRYLRNGIDGHAQKNKALLGRIQPGLTDLTALLDPSSTTYAELIAIAQRDGVAIEETLQRVQDLIPPRLKESLKALGSRAERKVKATGDEVQQFQAEIEEWFNHGMERASGVYRRNAKGIGLLIGLAIAFALNADTFYMFQRLSTDQAIRSSIVQTAERLEVRGISSPEALATDLSIDQLSEQIEGDLRSVGLAVEKTLADYPLPIGRTPNVLAAQQRAQADWPIPFIPQRLIGWGVTALALSMGASFWFDVLRKVTSVRASGNKPKG
ncbi:MAG: hypothetical protein HLUCCA11_03725 [Phormidesmis priestleyi Ana]|uniref:Uncharacterized protein n=1 Tax=Phormidesmis priestleyi Ana TaxID=1666911 RepID=A0A0P7ZTW9_9CYAN|nr:MAG: hypothetical protein HLUCCA11_03725 [Phormidesmis priestleyi Ana]